MVANFVPQRPGNKISSMKRKLSESDCDTLDLAVEQLSDDALGRFWGEFPFNVLLVLP